MAWMILNPRELDAVKDAVIRAKRLPEASTMRQFWTVVEIALTRGDELELHKSHIASARQAAPDWKSGFQAGFRAILSAADRHSL